MESDKPDYECCFYFSLLSDLGKVIQTPDYPDFSVKTPKFCSLWKGPTLTAPHMNSNFMAENIFRVFYFHIYPIDFHLYTAISLSCCMKISCCLQCLVRVWQLQHKICIRKNYISNFKYSKSSKTCKNKHIQRT